MPVPDTKIESTEVEMNRRNDDRRQENVPVDVDRRKVQRRRQIDPTTCERDYSNDEIEFMHALDDYKRRNGRMFPTCSEILEVIRELGYVRTDTTNTVPVSTEDEYTDATDVDEVEFDD